MKAVAVIPSKREIRLVQQDEPELSTPSDVKLRMIDVGICGTDREIAAFQYGTPPTGSDYLVIGHESLGEVIEVGPAVTVRTVRTFASREIFKSAGSKKNTASWLSSSWMTKST